MNKAEQVAMAYNDAQWDNYESESCYAYAIAEAHALGGIETYNSNDENTSFSFAPTRTFEFDDQSVAEVTYGSVFVISWEYKTKYKPLDKWFWMQYNANSVTHKPNQ